MKRISYVLILIALLSTPYAMPQPLSLTAEKLDDRVRVTVDGETFTEYKYTGEQKYPYFYPVNGPQSGTSVTTETSEPYPHHHSLFFGCDRVNGGNYWQDANERGQIVPREVRVVKASGSEVVFEQDCVWQRPGAPSPFKDERRIHVTAPSKDLRIIDFYITLTALIDVTIENTNHALFAARVVPELSAQSGGALVNALGDRGEKETFGKPAPWCGYTGSRGGVTEGIAIFSHPKNRWYPEPWFTRDYGFFSPTPMNWLDGGKLEIAKDETLSLRYRVVVHAGEISKEEMEKLFAVWKKTE